MDRRLATLLDLLDDTGEETVSTSVRLPVKLRDAAALANELGLGASTSELTVQGLRDLLGSFAQRRLLDAHYRAHPEAKPDLAEVAMALAQLDGRALAEQPELIRRAAREVIAVKPSADADDVLLYAAALSTAA